MEKMTTKKPDIKSTPEGPKVVRGYEKGPVPKDPESGIDNHDLAQEAIRREQEIAKYQKEILKSGQQEMMGSDEEIPDDTERSLDLPLNEHEVKVFNNLGYNRELVEELKNKFEGMSPGQAYNEMQILSVKEMIKLLSTKEEYQPGKLIGKLEIILEKIKNINDNGETVKPFKDIMENANEATSSLLMEDLNGALKESGYKGKVLGIFGKKSCAENFQVDLVKTFLSEEGVTNFEKIENKIKKDGSKYEKVSGMSGLAEGASQRQRDYGKNGLKVKIEDLVKEIK